MDRRSSPINDLYGTSPEDRSPQHKSHAWLYVLLTVAGFFVFESVQPVMRLRPDPPPSVIGTSLDPSEASHDSQIQMARVCWDYAIASVENVYPYGRELPRNPPIGPKSKSGKPTAMSALCWPRLRNAWSRRESWVRSYRWDTDWLTNSNSPFQRTIFDILNKLSIVF
ncbi:MAG TPA: hypothetical protein VJW77_12690 [Terriglobia bacterium]|nr:hypothetical protein [Terriglobia bacterium]